MYRMNPYNRSTPHDRLDPRMLARIANEQNRGKVGCGCDGAEREVPHGMPYASPMPRENAVLQNSCGCGCGCNNNSNYSADFNHTLAMVYSPLQEFQNLYCEEEALTAGTIFRELDKPFYGPKCHGGSHYE